MNNSRRKPIRQPITSSRCAEILGISARRVRQLVAAGKLPAMKTPAGSIFDRAVVEQLARERAPKVA